MDKVFGKYRAICRDNTDPERTGRIRVECPQIYGTGRDNWSSWCAPCMPYGSFQIPDEGSYVWVEFEEGDADYPIWTGCWPQGTDTTSVAPAEAKRVCDDPTCNDCEDKFDRATVAEDDSEHKRFYTKHPKYYCPRRRVLLKSERGHAIVYDDKDGHEKFDIIDAVGQILRFESHFLLDEAEGNKAHRGEETAIEGLTTDEDVLIDDTAIITLKGFTHSFIQMFEEYSKPLLNLVNVDRDQLVRNSILLKADPAGQKMVLLSEDLQGTDNRSIIEITPTGISFKIVVGGNVVNELFLNGQDVIQNVAGNKTVVVTGNIDESVGGTKKSKSVGANEMNGGTIKVASGGVTAIGGAGIVSIDGSNTAVQEGSAPSNDAPGTYSPAADTTEAQAEKHYSGYVEDGDT